MATTLEVILKARDELTRTVEKAKSSTDDWGRSLAMIQKVAGTLAVGTGIAAFGAIIKRNFDSSMQFAGGIDKMSDALGLSTDMVQRLDHALKMNDGSVENSQRGILAISQKAYEAARGVAAAQKTFSELGISVRDTGGHLKSVDKLVEETMLSLAGIKSHSERASIAQAMFGRATMDLMPALNDGKEAFSGYMQEADRLGLVLGKGVINKFEEAERASITLDTAMKVLSANCTVVFAPAFTALAKAAAKFLEVVQEIPLGAKQMELDFLVKQADKLIEARKKIEDPSSLSWWDKFNNLGKTSADRHEELAAINEQLFSIGQKRVKVEAELQKLLHGESESSGAGQGPASDDDAAAAARQGSIRERVDRYNERQQGTSLYEGFQEGKKQRAEAEKKQEELDLDILKAQLEAKKKHDAQVLETDQILAEAQANAKTSWDEREIALLDAKYTAMRKKHAGNTQALATIDKAYTVEKATLEKSIQKDQIARAHETTTVMVGQLYTVASKWKEFAGVYKAIATAQAIWDTYQAANSAYASASKIPYAGWILGPIAAGVAIAAGLANVASIKSTKFALGGTFTTRGPQTIVVGDNPGGVEDVSVTPRSSQNIRGPGGGGIPITVNLYDSSGTLADTVTTELRDGRGDRLIDEISRRLS